MFSNPRLQEGPLNGGGFVNARGGADNAPMYMTETIRPLTIKQLLTWDTDSAGKIFIDDTEVTKIKIVGQVTLATNNAPCYTYVLADGSDEVTVKVYGITEFKKGDFVAVYGRPDSFGGGKEVFAFGVKRIDNPWEIRYHFFAAVADHVARTKTFNRNKLGMISLPGVPRRAELIFESSAAAQEARKRKLLPFTPSPYKRHRGNVNSNSGRREGLNTQLPRKRSSFPVSGSPVNMPPSSEPSSSQYPKIPGIEEEEIRTLSSVCRDVLNIVWKLGGISGKGPGVKPEIVCVQLPLLGLQAVRSALMELLNDGLIEETSDCSFVVTNMTG